MPDRPHAGPGAAFLLSQLGGQVSRAWTQRLAAEGMEPREVMLFRFVARNEGRTQAAVAAAIGLPASRITGLVDRLEARGWIERRPLAGDRRARVLYVTEPGRRVLATVGRLSREHEEELTRGLEGGEREQLVGLLERVAATHGLRAGVHPGFADPEAEPAGDPIGGELAGDDQGPGTASSASDPRPGR